jgi:hypothetical protein
MFGVSDVWDVWGQSKNIRMSGVSVETRYSYSDPKHLRS